MPYAGRQRGGWLSSVINSEGDGVHHDVPGGRRAARDWTNTTATRERAICTVYIYNKARRRARSSQSPAHEQTLLVTLSNWTCISTFRNTFSSSPHIVLPHTMDQVPDSKAWLPRNTLGQRRLPGLRAAHILPRGPSCPNVV